MRCDVQKQNRERWRFYLRHQINGSLLLKYNSIQWAAFDWFYSKLQKLSQQRCHQCKNKTWRWLFFIGAKFDWCHWNWTFLGSLCRKPAGNQIKSTFHEWQPKPPALCCNDHPQQVTGDIYSQKKKKPRARSGWTCGWGVGGDGGAVQKKCSSYYYYYHYELSASRLLSHRQSTGGHAAGTLTLRYRLGQQVGRL